VRWPGLLRFSLNRSHGDAPTNCDAPPYTVSVTKKIAKWISRSGNLKGFHFYAAIRDHRLPSQHIIAQAQQEFSA
jgi:hypothetical protein